LMQRQRFAALASRAPAEPDESVRAEWRLAGDDGRSDP